MKEVSRRRILVVDDDSKDRAHLECQLAGDGQIIETAIDGADAFDKIPDFQPQVIISDIHMPRVDGYELIQMLKKQQISTPVILLTQSGTIDQAVAAVHRSGAYWFLEKPVASIQLHTLVERAWEQSKVHAENDRLRNLLKGQQTSLIVGSHPKMKQLLDLVAQLGPTKSNVLLSGESGTGKEIFARSIHDASPRRNAPFVAINCAAIPEGLVESELFGHERGAFTGAFERQLGKFELAHGGTLFLDEIGELPLNLQPKLLRVLEESKFRRLGGKSEISVDVRLIAATNRKPENAVADGLLREDLFYRLAVFQLEIPPLRERREDIPLLAAALLSQLDDKHHDTRSKLSAEVLVALSSYAWPGNVRELRNVLERGRILAGDEEICLRHLPANLVASQISQAPKQIQKSNDSIRITIGTAMEEVEKALILATYEFTGQSQKKTAGVLGLSSKTIQNKLKLYFSTSFAGS